MEEKTAPSLKRPEILFLSLFGIGFVPKAPGTIGTLAILPLLYWLGKFNIPLIFSIPFLLFFTCLSIWVIEIVQKKTGNHDPGWIVIDEVLGMSVAWLFSKEAHFTHLALLFLFFRFFDITKIWPANFCDKKIKHGAGTILDDIISGIYTGIAYRIICFFYPSLFFMN